MIAWLLLKLGPFKWMAAGIAALAVFSYIGVLKFDLWRTEGQLKTERAERAIERTNALQAAVAAGEQFRALESSMQRQKEEAEIERTKQQKANARVVADLQQQLVGVRSQLASYAAGGRDASDDTVADCRRRADALGEVLSEALRVQGELAIDAESEAADARSLRQAWPVTP